MATPSPPKPWERRGTAAGSSGLAPGSGLTTTAPATAPALPSAGDGSSRSIVPTSSQAGSSRVPPPLPRRSRTLNAVVNRTAASYAPYSSSRYGTSTYSPYGSYSSPYSRLGGGMYGGMGGYGSMYGGMNYGMGAYGAGYPGNPNDPNSLTNTLGQSTQTTFQIIESIVGAFANFAQMLESTYMATHSSFFAMVSVAEQFGNLRNTLGSILGVFALLRWFRSLFGRITGHASASPAELTPSNFASFESRRAQSSHGGSSSSQPRPSKKPLVVFLFAVFGLPYLMGKLIRAMARAQGQAAAAAAVAAGGGISDQDMASGSTTPLILDQSSSSSQAKQLDPSKFEFCRVLYDFNPESVNDGLASASVDVAVKRGDLVAVLSKLTPTGKASEWWRCRTRDGRTGYLPSPYLEPIPLKAATATATATTATTAAAVTGSDGESATEPIKAITSGSGSGGGVGSGLSSPANRVLDAGAASGPGQGGAQPSTTAATIPNTSSSTSTASASVPPAATSSSALPNVQAADISVDSFQKSRFFYS